jgi:hypothetical protein
MSGDETRLYHERLNRDVPGVMIHGGPDAYTMGRPLQTLDALRQLGISSHPGSLRFVTETLLLYAWFATETGDEQLPGYVRPVTGDGAWIAIHTGYREVTAAPAADDDVTAGAYIGELRLYDDVVYLCTRATEGDAVWLNLSELAAGGTAPVSPVEYADGETIGSAVRIAIIRDAGITVNLPSTLDVDDGHELIVRIMQPDVTLAVSRVGDLIDTPDSDDATSYILNSVKASVHLCAYDGVWIIL